MRTENTEASWRLRLGDRARQLVLSVMPEDGKPDGDLLEKALANLDQEMLLLTNRAEVLTEANARLVPTITGLEQRITDALTHNAMLLGVVYRQLYSCRQLLALLEEPSSAVGSVIEKTLDVLQSAEETYLRLIPDAERRFPEFEQKLENEFLEKLEAANRAKQAEKARAPGKDEEKAL